MQDDDAVLTLGGRHKKSSKNTLHVGKVYADWCGHCQSLKPEWDRMKNDMKLALGRSLKNVHIQFVEIGDTPKTKAKGLTVEGMITKYNGKHFSNSDEKLKSDGYPTIFKVLNGKLEYYTGNREAAPMYTWFMHGVSTPRAKKMMGGNCTRSKKPMGLLASVFGIFTTGSKNKSRKNKSRK